MSTGRFLKFKDVAGEYRFNLQSANNKIIMKGSEGYSSSAACDKGIASVKVNSQIDERYKKSGKRSSIKMTKDNLYCKVCL